MGGGLTEGEAAKGQKSRAPKSLPLSPPELLLWTKQKVQRRRNWSTAQVQDRPDHGHLDRYGIRDVPEVDMEPEVEPGRQGQGRRRPHGPGSTGFQD